MEQRKTHPVVHWVGLIAGTNLVVRGLGLLILPAVGIPLDLLNRRIWPLEFLGDDGTAIIWTIVGLMICGSLLSGERLPVPARILVRVIGLWTYWNMMLIASILTIENTYKVPWIWGAWVANWIICLAYTYVVLNFAIAPQRRTDGSASKTEDPEDDT